MAQQRKKTRAKPAQPTADEQSGSTGRRVATGNPDAGADTGQDRYGQSGYGGKPEQETMGQAQYRRSGARGDAGAKTRSNRGPRRVSRPRG